MSSSIRVLLILGSLLTVIYLLSRIRKSKMQIEDSLFWLAFSGVLIVISIFPEIPFWCSRLLGFEAPINFVYLVIIFLLILKLFYMSIKISQMDNRIRILTQRIALNQEAAEREKQDL